MMIHNAFGSIVVFTNTHYNGEIRWNRITKQMYFWLEADYDMQIKKTCKKLTSRTAFKYAQQMFATFKDRIA